MPVRNRFEFDSLLNNKEYSDFEFILKNRRDEQVIIPVHKLILSSGSPFFKEMFYGDGSENLKSSMVITDASAEAFEDFLQLFYSSRIAISTENIYEVLNLAQKKGTQKLLSKLQQFMLDTLNDGKVLPFYDAAHTLNLSNIVKNVLNRKILFEPEVPITLGYKFDRKYLIEILESDELMCAEYSIFHSLISYARNSVEYHKLEMTDENVKKFLDEYWHYIRFPLMEKAEIVRCLQQYPQFPRDQYDDLVNHFDTGAPLTVAKIFNSEPRSYYLYSMATGRDNTVFGDTTTVKIRCAPGHTFRGAMQIFMSREGAWDAVYPETEITVKNGKLPIRIFSTNKKRWTTSVVFDEIEITIKLNESVEKAYRSSLLWRRQPLPSWLTIECEEHTFIHEIFLGMIRCYFPLDENDPYTPKPCPSYSYDSF